MTGGFAPGFRCQLGSPSGSALDTAAATEVYGFRTFLLPFLLNLAGRDPHDLDGVADHVGGTLLALGSAGHVLIAVAIYSGS